MILNKIHFLVQQEFAFYLSEGFAIIVDFFFLFFFGGEIIIVEIELYLFSNISFKRIVRCKTEAGLIPGTRILKYLKELVVVLNAWTKDSDIFIGSKSHVYVSFVLVVA